MTMTNKNLKKLTRALDRCTTSTEYVDVIRKITRTQDPDAIEVLASLLDSPGPVGAAAVRGLISFGQFAEGEMRRCLAQLDGRGPDPQRAPGARGARGRVLEARGAAPTAGRIWTRRTRSPRPARPPTTTRSARRPTHR